MQSAVEVLRHEAASLYRLVDFIAAHLDEQESTHTYLDSSKSFFAHIRRLAKKTKNDLDKTVKNAEVKLERIENLLVAAADGAILAGPVGATLPIVDGSEWSIPK